MGTVAGFWLNIEVPGLLNRTIEPSGPEALVRKLRVKVGTLRSQDIDRRKIRWYRAATRRLPGPIAQPMVLVPLLIEEWPELRGRRTHQTPTRLSSGASFAQPASPDGGVPTLRVAHDGVMCCLFDYLGKLRAARTEFTTSVASLTPIM